MSSKTMAKIKRKQNRFFALVFIVLIANVSFNLFIFYLRDILPYLTSSSTGELKIATRYSTNIWNYFEQAFLQSPQAKEHGIKEIKWYSPSMEQMADYVRYFNIDLVLGEAIEVYDTLYNLGLLKKLSSTHMQSVLSQINETIANAGIIHYDDDGDPIWVAASMYSYGFTINKEWLSSRGLPFPTHWENLSNPEYGQFLPDTPTIIINPYNFEEMTSIIEIILQEFGWEKGWEILARMTGNADFDSTSNPFIIYDAGILISDVIHGLQFMQQFPSYDFEFRIPINEAIIQGNPIAIGGKTSNQAAAEAFIDFILSTDGQKQWLREDVNQLPIQESAFNTDIGNDRTDLYNYYNQTIENLINYNESLANSYKYSIYYYYQSVDFNAHTRLVDCWKLLLDYYYADPVGHKAQFETWAAEMAAPVTIVDPYTGNTEVFDVDYAKSINKLIQTDNDYRILVMEEWRFASYPLPWPPLCLTKR